jgi:hypothetical protein
MESVNKNAENVGEIVDFVFYPWHEHGNWSGAELDDEKPEGPPFSNQRKVLLFASRSPFFTLKYNTYN